MSEVVVTTSKGRGGRGKKTKEEVDDTEKTQEPDTAGNKKGAIKRKNAGKKEETSTIEENGQVEIVSVAPLKKGGRVAKGKVGKTNDDDGEDAGDDNDAPVEQPKRGSRARKEVVYKEVDEDIDNKKKRGVAKPEAKIVPPKKAEKKLTKSKVAAVKTKKVESEEEGEADEEPNKDSGDDDIQDNEEKEELIIEVKAVADEDDEAEEEEEIPPTKKSRGGRSKPATKKDTDKTSAVAEKSSRKRGGKKTEEVAVVKNDSELVTKPKTRVREKKIKQTKTRIAETNKKDPNVNLEQDGNEGVLPTVVKRRNERVIKPKSSTPELGNITIRKNKLSSKRKLILPTEELSEIKINQNESDRKEKKIPKRKINHDTDVKCDEPTEVKQIKLNKLVSINKEYTLKISTWNVAGIRAWINKGGLEFIERENPDIICLQETKCLEEDMPDALKNIKYHPYYLCKTGGYAGIAIYSKIMPMKIEYGIGDTEFDKEGRILTAEYEKFFLICTYVPNSGRNLINLNKRMKWNKLFKNFVKNLDNTLSKPVIICGDMNVSHLEIDLANPKTNKRNAGFTQEERDDMTDLLKNGFVDTFRHLYPDKRDSYTYWTYMFNSRARNVGWRLDYFIMSERMISRLVDNVIQSEVYGSDHCPITLFLNMNKPLVSN